MAALDVTAVQRREFATKGWTTVSGVFSSAEVEALQLACDELLQHPGCSAIPGNPRVQLEPETMDWQSPVVRKVEPVIDMSAELAELVHDPRMKAAAAAALGVDDVILFEDKLNYKPPRIGSSYPLHQDRSYWLELAPGIPATDRLVTVTLLLDDATPENGCLRLVPGSQAGLMEKAPGEKHALVADPMTAVDAPGKAGDLLLFSVYTAHHSFANRSDHGRRVLLYTYNPESEGDSYATYKGAHGLRCQQWLKENTGLVASLPPPVPAGQAAAASQPVAVQGYSVDDPRRGKL